MKLIQDLQEISKRSQINRKRNFDFRAKIKWESKLPEALDELVVGLNKRVSAALDSRQCTNCCRTYEIILTQSDVKRLAEATQVEIAELQQKYLNRLMETLNLALNPNSFRTIFIPKKVSFR